jgi:hypothetical protein
MASINKGNVRIRTKYQFPLPIYACISTMVFIITRKRITMLLIDAGF